MEKRTEVKKVSQPVKQENLKKVALHVEPLENQLAPCNAIRKGAIAVVADV